MAAARAERSEDQFLCSICLEVFTNPVSTPCGHNFCKTCITQHWAFSNRCFCPMCKEAFPIKPELRVNTFISQMVCQFRQETEREAKILKASLKQAKAETQHMLELRRLKIKEIRRSIELSQKTVDRETTSGLLVFTALMQSVQTRLDQFIEGLHEKYRQTQKQAQDLIRELEHEISDLEKRSTEVEQLSQSEDHFTSLRPAAALKDWSTVSFEPETFQGSAATALSELKEELSQMEGKLNEEMNKMKELNKLQQFAVDITLDPVTAQPWLVLSEDLKQVHHTSVKKDIPDNPKRFSSCARVLGSQGFSSGKFYFEVQVKGKTDWSLGVALESINRKGPINTIPKMGYWTIWLRNGDVYEACTDPPVLLSLKRIPQKVGVFVDYSEGVVSFYDVDTVDLIYSFTGCCFTDKLYPQFGPGLNDGGKNSAPMIITEI